MLLSTPVRHPQRQPLLMGFCIFQRYSYTSIHIYIYCMHTHKWWHTKHTVYNLELFLYPYTHLSHFPSMLLNSFIVFYSVAIIWLYTHVPHSVLVNDEPIYGVAPQDNGVERFLPPSDIVATVMSQHNALLKCLWWYWRKQTYCAVSRRTVQCIQLYTVHNIW